MIVGLGTLANVSLIVAGGLVGMLAGGRLAGRVQDSLMRAMGVAVVFTGLAGALEGLLARDATMCLVLSLVAGTLAGELADLEGRLDGLGAWLRDRTGNAGDARFVDGFVSATLTVCVGAMAIVGSIQDGISGDWSLLALKGVMDAVIVCAMTASLGRGCVFSAVPVAAFQGSVTLLARAIAPVLTQAALDNVSLVGSVLIACVGANLVRAGTFRVATMLPAVLVAGALAYVGL